MSSKDYRILSYEKELSQFLVKKISKAGGSIPIQHITGHLSQVRNEVRSAIASSKSDLIYFLKNHNDTFLINNDTVSLAMPSTYSTSGYESDTSSTVSHPNLPLKIKNGKGVIVKIFPYYGFIKSKEPIKTDIFFNSLCFGDKEIDLTSFLYVGAIVYFHAVRDSPNSSCKYKATKVWRIDNGEDKSNASVPKSRKVKESELYEPLNLESEGFIQNIFPNLGFISVKGDDKNTVFFHKNRVVNYDNIVDLTKVFSKGDRVEFTAHRSSKVDAKARWEATKVWKVSGKVQENKLQSGNNQSLMYNRSVLNIKTPEMIKDQQGKINPRSHGAVIKFGNDELADGDSASYYICGTQVSEIGWEFTEGEDVYFDAVKIKSAPGWKAILVWTGKKPDIILPPHLGDFSEFTEGDDNEESIYSSKHSLCMSESSGSSLKSERMSSKTKDIKDRTRKLSGNFSCREKNVKKLSKSSNASSRDSLNSLPLSDKFLIDKEVRDAGRKLSKNFNSFSGDSLNSLAASDTYHHFRSSEKMPSTNKIAVESNCPYPVCENNRSTKVSKSFQCESEIENFVEDEIENSSEYASAEEEKACKSSDELKDDNLKCAASIKKYNGARGEINKVFSRFAEIKSRVLQKPISFSLKEFYIDGLSTDDLGLDDLKNTLKVGDSINFNGFVIIDDSGVDWQKITLAWKGSKPGCSDEISPEDFIQQNDLSVTVKDEINDDDTPGKEIHRKFLTSFVDKIPDDDTIEDFSKTESCSEESSITLSPKSQAHSKTELTVDYERLSDTLCRLLKKEVFPKNSFPSVDMKYLSKEIINIVLQNPTKKTNALICNDMLEAKHTTDSLENICSKCSEKISNLNSSSQKTKNTGVQTIVTGDIISQNILPGC